MGGVIASPNRTFRKLKCPLLPTSYAGASPK